MGYRLSLSCGHTFFFAVLWTMFLNFVRFDYEDKKQACSFSRAQLTRSRKLGSMSLVVAERWQSGRMRRS